MLVGVGAMGFALWPAAEPSVLRAALAVTATVFLLLVPARGVVGGPRHGGASALPAELNRARRYGRALSLVRFEHADGPGAAQDLTATLQGRLREDDAVWADGRHVYVLLPEAARMDAASFVRRFRRTVTASPDVAVAVASFPEDGTTTGALVETLDRERPVPVDVLLDRLGAVVTPAFVDVRHLVAPSGVVPRQDPASGHDVAAPGQGAGARRQEAAPQTRPVRLVTSADQRPGV